MKRTLACFLAILMVLGSVSLLSFSTFAEETTTPALLTYSEGYTQPAGEGTESNPYLITCADDLLWMAKAHAVAMDGNKAYGGTNLPATGAAFNPFEGKFFVQTKDIDLGGKILPSIGLCNGASKEFVNVSTNKKYSVFGGNYDGQGYSISNGYIVNQDPTKDTLQNTNQVCYYYGTGLFGVIYNATIQNVNLKNVDLYTASNVQLGWAGFLVGMAVADITTTANQPAMNQIINCTVDADCEMTAKFTGATTASNARSVAWGGIVGAAYRTDITNCVNNATITANNTVCHVGGIAGNFLHGEISGCVNNGDIKITNVTATNQKVQTYRAFGGIVGLIPYNADTAPAFDVNATSIKNTANSGSISTDGAATLCYAAGGILGATRKYAGATLNILDCYNFGQLNTNAKDGVNHAEGAIVGAVQLYSATTQLITFNLRAKTVALADLNEGTVTGSNSNISTLKNGETVVCNWVNIGSSETFVEDNCQGNPYTCTAVSTADEISSLKKEADMITSCQLGIQQHLNTAGSYRFLATVNGAEWEKATFTVTLINVEGAKSQPKTIDVKNCYASIVADGETVTDPNGRMFIAFAIKDIAEGWGYEISVSVTDATGTYSTQIVSGIFG